MPRKVAQQPVQQPETDEQGQQKVCYLDNFLESAPACPTLGWWRGQPPLSSPGPGAQV